MNPESRPTLPARGFCTTNTCPALGGIVGVKRSEEGMSVLSGQLANLEKEKGSSQGRFLTPVYPLFLGVARAGRKC